jgi:transcriptional regulator with XRE-family HTH domain
MVGAHVNTKGESMGARFQRLREEARMTQAELAERAGIPVGTLRNWEQGIRVPRFDHAIRVAQALGVSLDVLAGLAEEQPSEKPKRKGKS